MFVCNTKILKQGELLGTGGFGKVRSYRDNWAVKVIKIDGNFVKLREVIQEIVLGFNYKHKALLPIQAFDLQEHKKGQWKVYIRMTRMKKSLKQFIVECSTNSSPIPKEKIFFYLYALVSGLEYLERKRIYHRDIKPENILINDKGELKLSDVGLAKFMGAETSNQCISKAGTLQYMAPEVYDGKPLEERDLPKADVWSLGVTIAELCLKKKEPLFKLFVEQLKSRKDILKESIDEIEEKYGQELAALLEESLLNLNPSKRKSFNQLKKILERKKFVVPMDQNNSPNEDSSSEKQKRVDSEDDNEYFEENMRDFNRKQINLCRNIGEKTRAIIKKLQSKWEGYFEFGVQKLFEVKNFRSEKDKIGYDLAQTSKIEDNHLLEMLEDCVESLESYKIREVDTLTIDLSQCVNVSKEGITKFGALIGEKFRSVKNFSLKLDMCPILGDEKCLIDLLEHICKNLGDLKSLTLSLYDLRDLNDIILENFKSLLVDLEDLEFLDLEFYGGEFTDAGVIELWNSIRNLRKLRHLSLRFVSYNKLTDQAIIELGKSISPLTQIRNLFLKFPHCNNFTDEGVESLCESVSCNLKKIEKISFDFSGCKLITNQAREKIENLGKNLRNIKWRDLKLPENNTDQISENIQKQSVKKEKEEIKPEEKLLAKNLGSSGVVQSSKDFQIKSLIIINVILLMLVVVLFPILLMKPK